MAIKIQRLPSVLRDTGFSRGTLLRRVAAGEFPKPISLGSGRAIGWIESEVQEWLAEQVKASRDESN
ncbi:AlpA family transcriptional regulator [Marinobacterium iners]|uniref:helix-turn-helix transcriptional regulator n=1 Tax=Marinobacterium iners TaxID=48076 RepID=UPI001A8D17BF|nr:AlpA family phage regulatory protein [Marinobacterium iners]QSR35242.1 AlpA family transcriptional regulator [Marinobacterium iners]